MKLTQKTIEAGDLVVVVEYSRPLPHDTKKQRTEKHKATTEAQKKLNNKTAKGKCALLLAANFKPRKDYFITLTYDAETPSTRKEALKNLSAFLRKLRTTRRRRGDVLKYVSASEHLHGDGRPHHHLVMNSTGNPKQDLEDLLSLWEFGHVDVSFLFDKAHKNKTWFDVGAYLTKERPIDGKDVTPVGSRVFSCSRNLVRPKPAYRIIDETERAVMPAGADPIEDHTNTSIVDGITVLVRWLIYQRRPHRRQC